tara:strand:+ start:61 stop:531 length:471 start_codon:yes stop_codon:yes gene_type:complete
MKKTYQIYANSTEGLGSDNALKEYTFDWGIIPEGEYEMTWGLMGKATKITDAAGQVENLPAKVSFEVPFMTDRYEVNSATGNAATTNVAGFLTFFDTPHHGGNHMRQFRAVVSDNAPVILRGKPNGNRFTVRCLESDNTLATMYPYSIVVNFKSIC